MSFDERRFNKHVHRFFVDADTKEEICTCGMPKDKELRGSKWKNKKTEFKGSMYDSQFEANVAADLALQKRGGLIKEVERQVILRIPVYGRHVTDYKADFLVTHNDGSQEVIEAKGTWTREGWLKWKIFEAVWSHDHPEVKLTVLKLGRKPVRFFKRAA